MAPANTIGRWTLANFAFGFAVCLALIIGGVIIAVKGSRFIGALENPKRDTAKADRITVWN